MWLENLIFGTSLKCRPYPSSLKCQKAHCTQNCLNSNYANLLSEKKLSKICLIKSHFPNDLRVSIWYKMINRPSFETYKVSVMENDRKIVESIFEFCENERDVFEVYKCIIDIFGKKTGNKNKDDSKSADLKNGKDEIKSADGKNESKSEQKNEDKTAAKEANNKEADNKDDSGKGTNSKSIDDKEAEDADDSSDVYDVKPVLKNSRENTISTHTTNDIYTSDDVDIDLLHLINYVLELPNCTKNLGYSILYTMFDRLQFDLVYFSSSSYKNVPYKDMKSTLTNLIKSKKIDYLLDRVFIYGPSSLTKILATTKGYSEREIDNACKPLNVKEIIPVVETKKDEEYFDFLVVQNEVAKAQECLKKQLVDKIEELCEKNKELELRNANLKSYIEGMEENLKSYESKYVDEIKEMMSVVRSQNEHLQKENETLKKRAQERE